MAKIAFTIDSIAGLTDLFLGFSWGAGGVNNTAVYYVTTVIPRVTMRLQSTTPATIPEGFPGLNNKRIFLDVMGNSITTAFLDVDFKIYEAQGAQPIYQIPTTSIPVFGICMNFTINATVSRGGTVGNVPGRQFVAGMMKLITPDDLPQQMHTSRELQDPQFCGYTSGARLRAILGMCPEE